MKKITSVLLLFSVFLTSSCCIKQIGKPVAGYPVDQVFSLIHDQFEKALDSLKKAPLKGNNSIFFTEADVVLDNVVSAVAGGSLTILVFKPSYTYTRKKETTLTFSLLNTDKPPSVSRLSAMSVKFKNDPDLLEKLIINTAMQMAELKFAFDDKHPDHVEKDVEIDIAFTVDQSGGIDITGPLTSALSGDFNASLDVANTHTITLKFKLVKK